MRTNPRGNATAFPSKFATDHGRENRQGDGPLRDHSGRANQNASWFRRRASDWLFCGPECRKGALQLTLSQSSIGPSVDNPGLHPKNTVCQCKAPLHRSSIGQRSRLCSKEPKSTPHHPHLWSRLAAYGDNCRRRHHRHHRSAASVMTLSPPSEAYGLPILSIAYVFLIGPNAPALSADQRVERFH
jgi:hypothetical protein